MNREAVLTPAMIAELLDMIHNALFVVDRDLDILFTNSRAGKIFSISPEELMDKEFSELFMPEDVDVLVHNILAITREEGEIESEAMFRRPDGTTFLGRISGTCFKWDEFGEGFIFSIHDISEIKAIEKSLKNSERVAFLGNLVKDISHQIRNPIMVIGGVARRLSDVSANEKNISVILEEASRLENLLETLGRFTALPSPITREAEIGKLAADIDREVGKKVRAEGCNWECQVEENIGEEKILVDADLIIEAVADIALNSCESYQEMEGVERRVVQCSLTASDDEKYPFLCSIRDCGVGINEDLQERISSYFYTEKTGHAGMGLTFAKRIIEEQGGKMTIESQPGHGTTVEFHFIRERRRSLRLRRFTDLQS